MSTKPMWVLGLEPCVLGLLRAGCFMLSVTEPSMCLCVGGTSQLRDFRPGHMAASSPCLIRSASLVNTVPEPVTARGAELRRLSAPCCPATLGTRGNGSQ